MKHRCVISVGQLLIHPCARRTTTTCTSCGQYVCAAHLKETVCVVCSGTHIPPRGVDEVTLDEMMSFDGSEIGAFDDNDARGLHEYES